MIRLRALGHCEFEIGSHHVTPESDVLFALLLLLTSKPGQPVSRADVMELLWPGSDGPAARHRLRQALYQLKKLGTPLTTPEAAIVVRKSDVEVDYLAYRDDREAWTAFVGEPRHLDVLPRYAPGFSRPFARWVEAERDRVRGTLRRWLLEAIVDQRALGDPAGAILFARACLQLDPLNEEATFNLAESLALVGEPREALDVVDQYRADRRSADEESSRSLIELRHRIVESARQMRASRYQQELVGRSGILRDIDAWVRERPGTRPILAIMGEPGIGKTRLLGETRRLAALHGVGFLEYRSSANGEDRPLAGLLDLLPRMLSLPGAVGCAPESYARLTNLARGVQPTSAGPADTTDSAFRFAVLRRSVLDLLEAVLSEGDIILSLDDAHALDRPSLEILLDATRMKGHGLALLLALRPDGTTDSFLRARTDVRFIRVPRLDPQHARVVVTGDLPESVAAERATVIDWAVDLADGNPLFLVELSAHCRQEHPVALLPQSLQIALEGKLEAISPTARLVVQSCAVLAQNATLARLETMLDLPPHATAAAFAELEMAGLITSRDGWIGCRHDLIAEAVIKGLGKTLSAYLHRRSATLLDGELGSSPLASLAWDCAEHWAAAAERDRALALTEMIVDRLLSLGLPQAAVDLCQKAERHCRTEQQHAERLRRLGRACRLMHDWDGVVRAFEQRRTLVGDKPDRRNKYSEDDLALFEARWWRDHDTRVLRRSLTRVKARRAPALARLRTAVVALIAADNRCQLRQASDLLSSVEAIHPSTPHEETEKLKALAIYHTSFGDLDVAVSAARRLVEFERSSANVASLARALRWLSMPLKLSGDITTAVATLTESYTLASSVALKPDMLEAALYLQDLAIDCEDSQLARIWARTVARFDGELFSSASRSCNNCYLLARLAVLEEDLDRASALLRRATAPHTSIRFAKAKESLLALDVFLTILNGSRPSHDTLSQLRRLHMLTRVTGARDFETGVLLMGLTSTDFKGIARQLNEQYLSGRRTRMRQHSVLAAVQSALA